MVLYDIPLTEMMDVIGYFVEEVSIKWMDKPSVTEMERGGVYEMKIEISSIHFCDTYLHNF